MQVTSEYSSHDRIQDPSVSTELAPRMELIDTPLRVPFPLESESVRRYQVPKRLHVKLNVRSYQVTLLVVRVPNPVPPRKDIGSDICPSVSTGLTYLRTEQVMVYEKVVRYTGTCHGISVCVLVSQSTSSRSPYLSLCIPVSLHYNESKCQ